MNPEPDHLWTVDDLATWWQVSPNTIRAWQQNGQIPYIKLGRHVRFDPDVMRRYVDSRTKETI